MAWPPSQQSGRYSTTCWWSIKVLTPLFITALTYISSRPKSSNISTIINPQHATLFSAATLGSGGSHMDIVNDSNLTLHRRDEYACKKGTPCKQYACCGGFDGGNVGECGLGPTWCGSDCDSQCNAKAECTYHDLSFTYLSDQRAGGSWAEPPGKLCPLNVCCSQYGFCGSTSKFCDASAGCQSNCGVDPPIPPGRSSSTVLNRVIGYYESWLVIVHSVMLHISSSYIRGQEIANAMLKGLREGPATPSLQVRFQWMD